MIKRQLWIAFIGGILAACQSPAAPSPTTAPPSIPQVTPEIEVGTRDLAQEMLDLVNAERCQRNLTPLILNDILIDVALQHSRAMAEQDFFDHINPKTEFGPADRVSAAGYAWSNVGENIAAGQIAPQEVFDGWMNSRGHRENILNPDYQEMGLGYVQAPDTEYGFFWTQVFGTQLALRDSPPAVSCDP